VSAPPSGEAPPGNASTTAVLVTLPRPEPSRRAVYALSALFLTCCALYGAFQSMPRFGALRYSSNVVLVPPRAGHVGVIGPFELTGEDNIEFVVSASHPRPEDTPTLFAFEWSLRPVPLDVLATLHGTDPPPAGVSGPPVAEGVIGFSHAQMVREPDDPPLAFVPIPATIVGTFVVEISPRGVADWPDVEWYVVRRSETRVAVMGLGLALLGAFVASASVVAWRQRAAVRAWRRLDVDAGPYTLQFTPPTSDGPPPT